MTAAAPPSKINLPSTSRSGRQSPSPYVSAMIAASAGSRFLTTFRVFRPSVSKPLMPSVPASNLRR